MLVFLTAMGGGFWMDAGIGERDASDVEDLLSCGSIIVESSALLMLSELCASDL